MKDTILKRFIITTSLTFIIGILLLMIVGLTQAWEKQDNTMTKEYPQYLLILRYWGTILERGSDNFSMISTQGWKYMYAPYNSIEEVLNRLNTYTGHPLKDKSNLVGLWKLGEDKNIINILQLETTKHSEPVRIEKKEWKEYNWKINNDNP